MNSVRWSPEIGPTLFETEKDAHITISKMPRVFDGMSYIFSVEVAD